ncbi:MAG: SUMF1/EgtB/PvdO family nonheme iron enzyme [Elusimicrobiales bacterium]
MNKVCPYCGHNRNTPWDDCCRRCGKSFFHPSLMPAAAKWLAVAAVLGGAYLLFAAKYGHKLPPAASRPAEYVKARATQLWREVGDRARFRHGFSPSIKQEKARHSGPRDGMAYIPAGTFRMGAPEENGVKNNCPVRQVSLTGFYMDINGVTAAEYAQCVAEGVCPAVTGPACNSANPARGNYPADCVTWHAAQAYCRWRGKTLPSGAQWETAARAGSADAYYFGADTRQLHRHIWYDRNSDGRTHPAGLLPPNGYGLRDMQGQIRQWVLDDYGQSCAGQNAPKGKYKILRGCHAAEDEEACRLSRVSKSEPGKSGVSIGFRCAAQ